MLKNNYLYVVHIMLLKQKIMEITESELKRMFQGRKSSVFKKKQKIMDSALLFKF